jgi:putative RNA 2'-phosphotransferase
VEVDLQLNPAEPPERLFHGTTTEALPLIKVEGLKKMGRHAVHLSPDDQTAKIVGGRRGAPVVLVVRAKAMHDGGYTFYCSDNGVWLVDSVPADFIEFPSIFEGSAESRIGRRT